jgi:hypothetical protein
MIQRKLIVLGLILAIGGVDRAILSPAFQGTYGVAEALDIKKALGLKKKKKKKKEEHHHEEHHAEHHRPPEDKAAVAMQEAHQCIAEGTSDVLLESFPDPQAYTNHHLAALFLLERIGANLDYREACNRARNHLRVTKEKTKPVVVQEPSDDGLIEVIDQ